MKKNIKNYGKKILSLALSAVLVMGMIPMAGLMANATPTEEMALNNGYLQVEVSEENGGFVIRTADGDKINKSDNNKMLLFHDGNDDTSFTSFEVTRNGETKEYIFGGEYEGSSDVDVSKENEEIRATWSVDDIIFVQTISLVNSGSNEHGMAYISYEAINMGEVADIKCRILLDTALGYQDYAYYNIGDGNNLVQREQTVAKGGYNKSFYAVDNPFGPSIVAYTVNAAIDNKECMPYKTTFAHWNNLASTVFEYEPDDTMTFTNAYNKQYLTADSACALYFDMGEVQKNQSSIIATNYGVFSNESVDYSATAAVNVIAPDVMELTTDKTAYKDNGRFTTTTAIENVGNITYDKVRVLVYTTGGITPLDKNGNDVGATHDEPYYMEFVNFVPGQRQTIEWNFKAEPLEEGSYSKISYKVYNVSDNATLNTGTILEENLMGEGQCYILCPGSVTAIPKIQFTSSSPDILYNAGNRTLNITGANFSMLENTSEYKLMLSRVDGQEFAGKKSVEIPAKNIQIDGAKNIITVVMNDECPGTIPEGQYQLTFDYTDSSKQDLTAPALRFQVKAEPQYKNESYGLLAIEKYGDVGDWKYRILTFGSEESYRTALDKGEIERKNILLEFRGAFSRNTVAEKDGNKVYDGISLGGDDTIVLNSCLDIEEGTVRITETKGSVYVDLDASIYTSGERTTVHKGIAAITELEAGNNYGLIPYEENGDRASYNFETITLLWPSVGQAAQNLLGFLFDFKYGELGAIYHEQADETRVVAFGAAMDLSFVVPKASQHNGTSKDQLGDAYNAAIHGQGLNAEEIRAINKRIAYNSATVDTNASGTGAGNEIATDTGDSASGADGDTRAASIQIDDVLFGGEFLGVNMVIALGLPGYVDGMPGIEGILTLKTIGDWEVGVSGVCDFEVCYFEAEVYIKSYQGMPVPDKLRFFLGVSTGGINLDGFGVLWLQGAGGGIDGIYDTIFMQDSIPPLKLIIEAQMSIMQVISARASLELSARGFGVRLSDGKLVNSLLVLNNASVNFQWYPEFYFLASVNMSVLDAIKGGGYIVVEENGFFEFFIKAALQVPGSVPVVGGLTLGSVGLGANAQKIWGQVEVLAMDFGVVYYWGGDIDWSGGSEAAPTYPELVDAGNGTMVALMSKDDVPVYYDEETGRTLYMHTGTNLVETVKTSSYVMNVKALENMLATNVNGRTHTFSLGANGMNKLLILEWNADSRQAADEAMDELVIKDVSGNNYDLVLLESGKDGSLQSDANANLTYDEETGIASLAIAFTNEDDFGKTFTIITSDVSNSVLYDVEALPKLAGTTMVDVEGDEVTVTIQGSQLDKYNSISFVAEKKSNDVTMDIAQLNIKNLATTGRGLTLAGNSMKNTATSPLATKDVEENENAQLVYKVTSENGFNAGQKFTFTLPENFSTGTYDLNIVATDNNEMYYSEIQEEFEYVNSNQPATPVITSVENVGDYKVQISVAESINDFDGYILSAYDKNGNPVSGLSDLIYYKDGSAVKYNDDGTIAPYTGDSTTNELVIGGHYEYAPDGDSAETVVSGFEAGDYTIGVKRWNSISNGKAIISSVEAIYDVEVKEPVKTEITVSANKLATVVTEEQSGKLFERPFYTTSELTLTLEADSAVAGAWELDNGTKEGTSGSVDSATDIIKLSFSDLEEGVHTLEFIGKNQYGDAVSTIYTFGVDTKGPKLLLSEPVSGAFFDYESGKLNVVGITDKEARLTVYDETADENIILNKSIDVDKDGRFAVSITINKALETHNLIIRVKDNLGNATEKQVQVVSDAMGSIENLMLYANDADVTNKKLSTGEEYELSLKARLTDGSIIEISDTSIVEWVQTSIDGSAFIKESNGKMVLSVPKGTEGIVTGKLLVSDNGSYPVSAAFGQKNGEKITINESNLTITVKDVDYTGEEVKPEPTVKYENTVLVKNVDYVVGYKNNIEPGEATIIITGTGNYTGKVQATFDIVGEKPEETTSEETTSEETTSEETTSEETTSEETTSEETTSEETTSEETTSEETTSEETTSEETTSEETTSEETTSEETTSEETTSEETTSEETTSEETTSEETTSEETTSEETTSEETTEPEKITLSISNLTVIIGDMIYTGNEVKPEPIVKYENALLVKDVDYVITYKNNVEPGMATMIISGIGNYTGQAEAIFKIVDNKPEESSSEITSDEPSTDETTTNESSTDESVSETSTQKIDDGQQTGDNSNTFVYFILFAIFGGFTILIGTKQRKIKS